MRWEDLIFLHWPVAPEALRPHIPDELELETFDGKAWLGVVPFTMAKTRFRYAPPVPTANRFPECNVRTYVRHGDRTGVWFFSLDAQSRLAVEGARVGFGLPYLYADMACARVDGRVRYQSERRDRRGPTAAFAAVYDLAGETAPATPGTLEHFLTERYCLFAERRGKVVCGEVAHERWQLSAANIELERCDMARLVDVSLQGPPASVLAASSIDVAAWSAAPLSAR